MLKKTISFIDGNNIKTKVFAELRINKDGKKVLSFVGEQERHSYGQITFKPANDKQEKLLALWKTWHLNDMHAGTEKQEVVLTKAGSTQFVSEYQECCNYLQSVDLLNDGGYVFGSGWTMRELPIDIWEQIESVA